MSLLSWAKEQEVRLLKVLDHSPDGTSQQDMNVREKVALLPGETQAGKPHSTVRLSHRMEPVCSGSVLVLLVPWAGRAGLCVSGVEGRERESRLEGRVPPGPSPWPGGTGSWRALWGAVTGRI